MFCPICNSESTEMPINGLNRNMHKCLHCGHIYASGETHDYSERGIEYFNQNCNHQGITSTDDSPAWDNYTNSRITKLVNHNMLLLCPIVEIGCLEGQVLRRIKNRGKVVVGYETNKDVAALNEFVRPYPITEEKEKLEVGGVFSFHVFEHLSNPVKTINKIYDMLIPSGKVFIEVPIETDWWNPDHIQFYNSHSLTIMLSKFKSIQMTGDHFINCHGMLCEQIQVSAEK